MSQLYHDTVSTVHHMGTVETKIHHVYELIVQNINYLWLLLMYDILVHKQNKYIVKNHSISASSFFCSDEKTEIVSTVLSLPYCIYYCDIDKATTLISVVKSLCSWTASFFWSEVSVFCVCSAAHSWLELRGYFDRRRVHKPSFCSQKAQGLNTNSMKTLLLSVIHVVFLRVYEIQCKSHPKPSCGYPPSQWCRSLEIAIECGVSLFKRLI